MTQVGHRHVEGVRDARPTLLRGPGRAAAGQLDHDPLAADEPERLDRQPELPGEQDEGRGVARAARQHEPRRTLTEELDRRRRRDGQPEADAEPAPDRALGDGNREATARDVLGRGDETPLDGILDKDLDRPLAVEIERRRPVFRRDTGEL